MGKTTWQKLPGSTRPYFQQLGKKQRALVTPPNRLVVVSGRWSRPFVVGSGRWSSPLIVGSGCWSRPLILVTPLASQKLLGSTRPYLQTPWEKQPGKNCLDRRGLAFNNFWENNLAKTAWQPNHPNSHHPTTQPPNHSTTQPPNHTTTQELATSTSLRRTRCVQLAVLCLSLAPRNARSD